jgi:hypothetical protein
MAITAKHLRHALTHRKDCNCYKSEERDPKGEKEWPDMCPWWAYQIHRHATGDFSSPEWWNYQCGLRDDFSDEPPDVREFEVNALPAVRHFRDGDN